MHVLGSQSKIPPERVAENFAEVRDRFGSAVPYAVITFGDGALKYFSDSPPPPNAGHRASDHHSHKNSDYQHKLPRLHDFSIAHHRP